MPEITVAVVGIDVKGAAGIECAVRAPVGHVARLVREIHPRDRNAVQVHLLGRWVGYVPRTHNEELAAAMDNGAEPSATVSRQATAERGRIKQEPLIRVTW